MRYVRVLLLLMCSGCAQSSSTGSYSSAPFGLQPELLQEDTRVYTVFFDGNPIGEYIYSLHAETDAGRPAFRVDRAFTMPEGPVEQVALFHRETLDPIRSESRGAITVELQKVAGRVRGTVSASAIPTRSMDEPLPAGALLPYMFEAVLAISPLKLGYSRDFNVVNPASAKIEVVGVRVLGEETVTVPAGTFHVYKAEITGFAPEIIYVRKTPPHIPIKQDLPSPVTLQLARTERSR